MRRVYDDDKDAVWYYDEDTMWFNNKDTSSYVNEDLKSMVICNLSYIVQVKPLRWIIEMKKWGENSYNYFYVYIKVLLYRTM